MDYRRSASSGGDRTGNLPLAVYLSYDGTEQRQCAHPHLQPDGLLFVSRVRHNGGVHVSVCPGSNRHARDGRLLHPVFPLLPGCPCTGMDFLCLLLHRHGKHRMGADSFLPAHILDNHAHESSCIEHPQLLCLYPRAPASLLVSFRLSGGQRRSFSACKSFCTACSVS